jgi:hypothetical protein
VVVLEDSPLPGPLVAALVGAALDAASGRKVATTVLSNDAHGVRVLVASDAAVHRVRDWMASGVPWGDAIAKLHGGGS